MRYGTGSGATRSEQERTAEEYGQLFAAAGLRLTRVLPTQSDASILEGELVAAPQGLA